MVFMEPNTKNFPLSTPAPPPRYISLRPSHLDKCYHHPLKLLRSLNLGVILAFFVCPTFHTQFTNKLPRSIHKPSIYSCPSSLLPPNPSHNLIPWTDCSGNLYNWFPCFTLCPVLSSLHIAARMLFRLNIIR